MKTRTFYTSLILATLLIALIALSACGENSTDIQTLESASDDAAEVIAGNLALQTGGTVDQMADLCSFATPNGMEKMAEKYPNTYFNIERTYDYDAQEWHIHIERERGIVGAVPYAFYSRDYRLKYLNADGIAQQHYVTAADTARTVIFNVIEGSGIHKTHRISQQLNELVANWTVTNAHSDILTINGTYYRAAVDTISTFNRVRSSDHDLDLNITNVTMPRVADSILLNALSGTVTGHFHADIVFTNGASYSENTIDRDIDITFGEGKATIGIGPESYTSDLSTGDLLR